MCQYLLSVFHHHHHHQALDFGSRRGDLRAEEADVLLHAGLLAAVDRRSGMVMSVYSLMLSDQLLLCRPRLRPPSTVPCKMVLERLSVFTVRLIILCSRCQFCFRWRFWTSEVCITHHPKFAVAAPISSLASSKVSSKPMPPPPLPPPCPLHLASVHICLKLSFMSLMFVGFFLSGIKKKNKWNLKFAISSTFSVTIDMYLVESFKT